MACSVMRRLRPPLPYIALFAGALGAQDSRPAARPSRLLGAFDLNTGAAIEGAKVTDFSTGSYVMTSRTGTASLAFLPEGGGYVTVTKIGYEAWMQFVKVTPSDTSPITIVLKPTTTVLPEVVTRDTATKYASAGMREFQSRIKTGLGHYIVDSVLRKDDNREMGDVLRRIPGVKITCTTRTPRRCYASSVIPCSGRGMLIYRDGIRMTDTDLMQIPVNEISGVEVYSAATLPAQYNMTGGACGAILFWSR